MKVVSYMPLHYGCEYLRESILSFIDLVDILHLFYAREGSMGRQAKGCPDSRDELREIAERAAAPKIVWHDVHAHHEWEHRAMIDKYTNGYDLIFTSDADEIWDTERLQSALEEAYNSNARNFGIDGFINLWRSFNWKVVDGFRPVRIHNLHNRGKDMQVIQCPVWHMGYCQKESVMRYKFKIHGHKEIPSNYVDNKYYAWTEDNQITHLHPASNDIWIHAESHDKTQMPELLKTHENYNKQYV